MTGWMRGTGSITYYLWCLKKHYCEMRCYIITSNACFLHLIPVNPQPSGVLFQLSDINFYLTCHFEPWTPTLSKCTNSWPKDYRPILIFRQGDTVGISLSVSHYSLLHSIRKLKRHLGWKKFASRLISDNILCIPYPFLNPFHRITLI